MQGPRAVRLGFRLIEIIDQDQIKIGGRCHFARSELAESKHDVAPPLQGSVLLRESGAHALERRLPDDGCERRIGIARLRRVDGARQDSYADEETLLLRDLAAYVEKVFQ